MSGPALVAVIGLAAVLVVAALQRPPSTPRKPDQVVPAIATCADCGGRVPIVSRGGYCGVCGSSSIVLAWSYGAKLILRERARSDHGRFLRAGTPERRPA